MSDLVKRLNFGRGDCRECGATKAVERNSRDQFICTACLAEVTPWEEQLLAWEAAAAITALEARVAEIEAGPVLVDERTGTAYTVKRFHDRWAEVREAAIKAGCPALAGLQFRDLRRTFGRMSRAGGAEKGDVADVLGNSAATSQYLSDVYMAPEILSLLRAVLAVQRPQSERRRQA